MPIFKRLAACCVSELWSAEEEDGGSARLLKITCRGAEKLSYL